MRSDTTAPAHPVAEIETVEPEPSAVERRVSQLRANLYHGPQVLDLPPREWIVRSWLPLDALVVVYAQPGAGKSFYAVTTALELARGARWIDPLPRPFRVLYVAAEKPADIRDRAEAWSIGTEHPIPGTFMVETKRAPLTNPIDADAIIELIEQERVDVVILDTYAAMHPGLDENSSQATGEAMQTLDRLRRATRGGTIIAVHHAGKDSSRGMRGSTAFLAAADLTIELCPSQETIEARVTKANAGATPLPENYRLDPVTLPAHGSTEPRSVPQLIHVGAPVLSGSMQAAVIAVFDTHYSVPATRRQIEEALTHDGHKTSTGHLNKLLKRMTDTGQLERSGSDTRPRYYPAGSGSPLLDSTGDDR